MSLSFIAIIIAEKFVPSGAFRHRKDRVKLFAIVSLL
jgi:hypothetical protein